MVLEKNWYTEKIGIGEKLVKSKKIVNIESFGVILNGAEINFIRTVYFIVQIFNPMFYVYKYFAPEKDRQYID